MCGDDYRPLIVVRFGRPRKHNAFFNDETPKNERGDGVFRRPRGGRFRAPRGCPAGAAGRGVSRSTARVQGALLVAPGDPERDELRGVLPSWAPIVRDRLPFPSLLLGSHDDPYCSLAKAQSLADAWGSRFIDCGPCGHINAESGLGDWLDGLALLRELTDPKDI